MNYLAHVYLADPSPGSILGNLLADHVKGRDLSRFDPSVQDGIRLHRKVDGFTDCHPLVQRSLARISPRWGWYSGVLIDVYYDHLLAADWGRWSVEPLRAFVDRIHRILLENLPRLDDDGRLLARRLVETDRLFSYADPEGIRDTLARLSQRIRDRTPRHPVELESALPDLLARHRELAEDFHEFFPELIEFVGVWKIRLAAERKEPNQERHP